MRQLLQRYGVLFRDLLAREHPALRWGKLFRTLRIMELSGEVVGGRFFAGFSGPQFAAPEFVRELTEHAAADDAIWWVNAADPASPCGLGWQDDSLPPRHAAHHLVFHGRRLVLVSRRQAREIRTDFPPGAGARPYLSFIGHLLGRAQDPLRTVIIERIDDQPATASDLAAVLADDYFCERGSGGELRLSRRY